MKHIVCLTKSYNPNDFREWFKYHSKMNYFIHIIDNESIVDIKKILDEEFSQNKMFTYEKIKGWPNQWQLYDDILKDNRYNFKENDLIIFIDDDEYLWYYLDYWKVVEKDNPKFFNKIYETLEEFVDKQMNRWNSDCILMPQILMSTKELQEKRNCNLIDFCHYRRNEKTSQGKVIIRYKKENTYRFNCDGLEKGHVPEINGIRNSIVNDCSLANTTYGNVDETACLRLYHFHIKSEEDWKMKYLRGSAAVDHQWYDFDITKNKNFGNYDFFDNTLSETKKVFGI